MFNKHIDIIAIGDITSDAFIRLKDASVHCKLNKEDCELCVRFGDKVPFEYVKVIKAVGNAANASVSISRLGLRSALISNLGDDQNGKDCLSELQKNKVITSYIKIHKNKPTNYHFVLWYESDRTILVNHIEYSYIFPKIMTPKWIYLTSLASNTFPYHISIINYIKANPDIKLAFQPGTFQIKLGIEELGELYKRSDIFIANLDEVKRILKTEISDPKQLLKLIHDIGPKLVLITDNTKGAYMFDGDHHYHMPMYPDPRPAFDRTGCGDAFASTFVAMLAMRKTPLQALELAPINPMSVAQFVGAQEGLLSLEQLEWWLKRAPADYKPKEI